MKRGWADKKNLSTAGRQTLQGATFGWGDEVSDRIAALYAAALTDGKYSDYLKEARASTNKDIAEDWKEAPLISLGANIAGSIPFALSAPAKALSGWSRANSMLGAVGKGAAVGAGYGAVAGAGSSNPNPNAELIDALRTRAAGSGIGAGVGGGLGAAGGALSRYLTPDDAANFSKVGKAVAKDKPTKAQKMLAEQLGARPDLKDQLTRAESMNAASANTGIQLTLAEKIAQSPSDPLLAQQKILGGNPQTAGAMEQLYANRSGTTNQAGSIENALLGKVSELSPDTQNYDDIAQALINKGKSAQDKITQKLVTESKPYYEAAKTQKINTVKPFADGVSLKPSGQVERGGKYLQKIDIQKDGQSVGSILYKMDDIGTKGQSLTVKRIDVSDQGKGIGTEAYRQLLDENLAKGTIVKSDADISKPLQRVFEKLKNVGYDVKEADETYRIYGDRLTTLSRDERSAQMKGLPTEYKNGVRDVKPGYANLEGNPVYTIAGKSENLPKEVQSAIAQARRQYPSALEGLPDNSVEVLDHAKKVLDAKIAATQNPTAPNRGLERHLTNIKNDLLGVIDGQVPEYAQARSIYSGNPDALQMRKQIGNLAGIDDMNTKKVAQTLYGGTQKNAQMAANTLGPEGAKKAAALRILDVMDTARGDPTSFAGKIAPDSRTTDMLRTYAGGNQLDETLNVINQAKIGERFRYGSPTQPLQEASQGMQQAAGGALDLVVGNKVGLARKVLGMLGGGEDPKFYQDMMDLMTTDQGMDLVRQVANQQGTAVQKQQASRALVFALQNKTAFLPGSTRNAALIGLTSPQAPSPVFQQDSPQAQGLPPGFIRDKQKNTLPDGFVRDRR